MPARLPTHVLLIAFALALGFVLPGGVATAEDATPADPAPEGSAPEVVEGARIPVRVVDGKLVVGCDISTEHRRVPVNLFIELETPCGLQLHNQAASGIVAENRDGSANPITIHLPDLDIVVPMREHGPTKVYDDFTKFHSPKLGEIALVGTIGMEVLKRYHLVLDLASGLMVLAPPQAATDDVPDDVEGVTRLTITTMNDLAWCPVSYADGEPAVLALGTAAYDTVVDEIACDARGKPAGDIGALRLGDFDLAGYVAFRPEEVALVHADGALGTTGLNLLEHFRVEVDRVNRSVTFEQTKDAEFPKEDLAFFQARVEDEGDAMEAFLDAHPDVRLSGEAALLLVDLRLEEDAKPESFKKAVTWVNDTHDEDLRATAMLDLMKVLSDAARDDYALAAGEMGIESGRKDRYPDAVHKIHSKMGAILLDDGQGREAWRHLLSAAFGMPEDGMVNLRLGRFYESAGRARRAFSRYVQAVIKPESGPLAFEGMKRLADQLEDEERFSVDLVEKLIGGKVLNFGAGTKYAPDENDKTNRCVLVEFFTHANLPPTTIGGPLGNEGLISHFPREHAAFLCYHLPNSRLPPEPMMNELAVIAGNDRGVPGPFVHRINGIAEGPGAARAHQKERVYMILRREVLKQLATPSEHTLAIDARIDADGTVSGTFTCEGPTSFGHELHLVLAERGVLFPGKSEYVIHRMIARAPLLDPKRGERFSPVDGKMAIPFKASLSEIQARNAAFLDQVEASGAGTVVRMSTEIDPHQVTLVGYIRDWMGNVLQAVQVDPKVVEDEAK